MKPNEKRAAVLAGLVLLALGVYKDKLTVDVSNMGFGRRAVYTPQTIQVHPEVLNLQESFAKVAEAVKPSVVNISTIHLEQYQANPYEFFFMNPEDLFDQFFDFQGERSPREGGPRRKQAPGRQKKYYERKVPGTGSGVIIDPDGFILTNEHVVRGADEIKVAIPGFEKKFDGKVIGRDERTDLAVVKVNSSVKFPYVDLGDSDLVRVGDWAIAIGSPFGLEQTVTVGVISASRQNLTIEDRVYKDLIQTDAAINPGNSGGPLVNIHGQVIGVNTAIYTPSGGFAGIGFSIPINRAKEIIPQLREKGKVVRGWIGVILEGKIDEATAAVFGVPDGEGAMLREVIPGYAAAKAGLERGDVIRGWNGKKVKDNYDLQNLVQSAAPGSAADIKIIRNRKETTLKMTIEEAPLSLKPGSAEAPAGKNGRPSAGPRAAWLGAAVAALDADLRQRYSISEKESGVAVVEVEEGSKAEEIGLMEGDLVRAVNQKTTADLDSFKEVTGKTDPRNGIVLDILRQGSPRYLSYMGPAK